MRKGFKRLLATVCVMALAVSCCMGAGAYSDSKSKEIAGTGVHFTGYITFSGETCSGYTAIGRSPVYGDRKQIRITASGKSDENDSTSTSSNRVQVSLYPLRGVSSATGYHQAWIGSTRDYVYTNTTVS